MGYCVEECMPGINYSGHWYRGPNWSCVACAWQSIRPGTSLIWTVEYCMGCFWMWGLSHWTDFMPNVLRCGIDVCTGLHTVDDKEIPCERFWVILCASTFWVSHLFTRHMIVVWWNAQWRRSDIDFQSWMKSLDVSYVKVGFALIFKWVVSFWTFNWFLNM